MRCWLRSLTIVAGAVSLCLMVACPALTRIRVDPADAEIPLGSSHELSISSTDPRDTKFTCVTSNPLVARIDSQYAVHGIGLGHAVITAKGIHSGRTGSLEVSVTPGPNFNMSLPSDPAQVEPSMECEASLANVDCTLHFPGIAATIAPHMQDLYHRIALMGAARTREPGKPEVPFYTLHFAIPVDSQTGQSANWNVEVTPELNRVYEDMMVYPAQPPAWVEDSESDYPRPDFARDDAAYQSSNPHPGWDHQEATAQVGNLPVLEVRVCPVRYVPSEKRLLLARRVRVQVQFSSGAGLRMPQVLGDYTGAQAPGPEEWLADEVLNTDCVAVIDHDDLTRALATMDHIAIHDEAFELLIVTRPGLFAQARRLARWRQDTGTRVYLASLAESTYPDAESIRAFIMDLDTSNRAPTFVVPGPEVMSAVLLFGDAEIIPPHQGMNVRDAADPTGLLDYVYTVGTDLMYGCIRGSDNTPDVAVGRISVDTPEEAAAVVDKIIRYEDRPAMEYPQHAATYAYFDDIIKPIAWLWTRLELTQGSATVYGEGTGFIGNVLPGDYLGIATSGESEWPIYEVEAVVSDTELTLATPYLQVPNPTGDYGGIGRRDGRDDWEFLVGAERVRRFLADRGTTVRFGYTRSGGPDPIQDFYGSTLSPDLLTYGWDATYEDIQANWREGLEGLVVHSDHGQRFGWQQPLFLAGDPDGPTPGHLVPMDDPATAYYPILFSLNCDSGWFDNETDMLRFAWGLFADPGTGPEGESFCERALRYPDGGAVAAVGAIRGGDADANDRLLDGLMAALYPDYAEGSINPWRARPEFDRLGAAFRWAMFHQKTWLGADESRANYNMQIYHLHGDPMLRMRLPSP